MFQPNVHAFSLDGYLARHIEWGWQTFGSPKERTIADFLRGKRDKYFVDSCRDLGNGKGLISYHGQSISERYSDVVIDWHAPMGTLDHIEREIKELREKPFDKFEWTDLIILAIDGYLRAGGPPEELLAYLYSKQRRNMDRDWPDWRKADPTKAIEHVKGKLD